MTMKGNDQQAVNGVQAHESRQSPAMVDKFVIRLPQGLRDQIKQLSEQNHRSMNSEIIMVLEQHIQQNFAAMLQVEGEDYGDKDKEEVLTEKLRSLPADKREALLSLLT